MRASRHGFETISADEEPACAGGAGDGLNDVHLVVEQLRHDAVQYFQFLRGPGGDCGELIASARTRGSRIRTATSSLSSARNAAAKVYCAILF